EVRSGSHRQVVRGALLGLLIGGVTGGAIGALTYKKCVPDPGVILGCFLETSRGTEAAIGAAVFGLLGTGVGAIIGSVSKHDTWAPFATTGVRVGLRADPRRGVLGVQLTF
ncbi:MAG: hypothetical protein ABIT38_09805, partial [Gemmatimonadaceae bacterium]